MSVLFVTDPLAGLEAEIDSSVGLMAATQALGESVWVCQPEDLAVVDGRVRARVRRVVLRPRTPSGDHRWLIEAQWFDHADDRVIDVADEMSAVILRIDPPVNARYLHTTYLLDLVAESGIRVSNSPAGIREAHEKLLALRFPQLCPATVVTADQAQIRDFLADHGRAVIKPVDGFAGTDVWLLNACDPGAVALIESATRRGTRHVIVQEYLAAVEAGNKRLFLLDGEIIGSVVRRPCDTDFRIGPPVVTAGSDDRDRLIVTTLAPHLARMGLHMAGLDVIDGHLIEVNVTCPGGLHKTDALLGTDLCGATMRHLLIQSKERLQPCPI